MQSKKILAGIILSLVVFSSFKPNNNFQKVKEYLSVPGPVVFNKTSYSLSWSSHPNDNYYKQEYLPAGQRSETFTKMFMIEALVGNTSPKEAAQTKMAELDQRKKTDAVTNYDVIENPKTGDVLLDFVISSGDIVEWNAYRYMAHQEGSTKALVLFAYSRRGYGAGTTTFLKNLKTERQNDVKSLATYATPAIKIK